MMIVENLLPAIVLLPNLSLSQSLFLSHTHTLRSRKSTTNRYQKPLLAQLIATRLIINRVCLSANNVNTQAFPKIITNFRLNFEFWISAYLRGDRCTRCARLPTLA